MYRVAVIGTTGSGKSTLARQLAQKLMCKCVDLDDLVWDTNWVIPPNAVLRQRVDDTLQPDKRWVTSGNRALVQDIIWGRADTLVWLDYAFPIVLWRLTTRTLRRISTQETVCNGNRETLAQSVSGASAQHALLLRLQDALEAAARDAVDAGAAGASTLVAGAAALAARGK